ncbi:HET-domain-containing protein [Mycena sanguinolenta]|uniref:HET-domain-containing protein n=1 Tax=Mycena sanguinolenta TaxID=230812 RepID=A0A8H7DH07_9AGAR|nr:HET-domain-containing protein [Mycena sanguinolenta]
MLSAESQSLVCVACQSTLFSSVGFHAAWTAQSSDSRPYTYSVKMEDAQASAARGCNWCSLLVPELAAAKETAIEFGVHSPDTHESADPAAETFVVKVEFRTPAAGGGPVAETPLGLQTLHIEINDFYIGTRYHVYAEPDIGDIASKYITARATSQVHPEEFFDQARESLRVCTTLSPGHEDCIPPQTDERAFYAALSYVWGEDQPHKTTSHNIGMYTAVGLDAAHIPQTILDAIAVVKALGLRFLWVDAYCIIQDDTKDKQKEIARMRSIYRDAHVTLIAANAPRVSAGFLKDREALSSAIRLPFICPDDNELARVVSRRTSPLPARAYFLAWTLQYSCISQNPTAIGGAPEMHENVRLEPFMFRPDAVIPSFEQEVALRNRWNTIIGEYTRRDLTHEKDRLIAIGAVAEEFGRFWKNSEYIAGIWRHNLLEDLLWSKQHAVGGSLPGRPAEYRAPTWPWASVNGTVLTAEKMNLLWPTRRRYLCEIIHCEAALRAGDKSFGQVTGGMLQLQAGLIEMFWSPANSTLSLKDLGGVTNIVTRSAYRDCDEEASQADRQVYALPIRCCEGGGFGSIEGILVVPSEQLESNYCRIGSFVIGTLRPKIHFDPEAWLAGPKRKVSIV